MLPLPNLHSTQRRPSTESLIRRICVEASMRGETKKTQRRFTREQLVELLSYLENVNMINRMLKQELKDEGGSENAKTIPTN